MGGGAPRPAMTVIVRWHSALPIKQAVAVMRFGAEAGTKADARKTLERAETHYILGLTGLPPQMARMNPDQLKSAITLKTKTKEVLTPQDLKADRDPTGRLNVYAFFPRGDAAAPAITLEDSEVEVVVKAGTLDFKRKFNLKKMLYDGKLEI